MVPEGRGVEAEEGLGDIAAPGADEAGEAEDLARLQIEADVLKPPSRPENPHQAATSPFGAVSLGHLRDLAPSIRPTIRRG